MGTARRYRPGAIVVVALVVVATFVYGITHRTWLGGFVFATGGTIFNRVVEGFIQGWRADRQRRKIPVLVYPLKDDPS